MINSYCITIILYACVSLPLLLIIIDTFYRLLFLIVAHLSDKSNLQNSPENLQQKLLVLIVARNEESVIQQTLVQIRRCTEADQFVTVAVLADHCADRTTQIASENGAQVYSRSVGKPGKAHALSWFAMKWKDILAKADIVVVLDADTLIDKHFCKNIRMAFGPGVKAVQGFVHPVSSDTRPLTTLASFSEILSQKIDDAARSRLGWSVPLRGTGMAFQSNLFDLICNKLGTQVDDIELSVRLAELGVRVLSCSEAIIYDPKAENFWGLAKQRGRWLKGQRQIWTEKWQNILKLLGSGPSRWSLIYAMLLKPKTALVFVKLALIALMILWPFADFLHQWLIVLIFFSLLVDTIYLLIGLRFVTDTKKYLLAFLAMPLLILLWIMSWMLSIVSGQVWLRVRKDSYGEEPMEPVSKAEKLMRHTFIEHDQQYL